ncbi:putative glycerol-3-phosphate transporter 1 [Selaginella moellendorffii]|uniref:putative glycerol-3-phosphate transporter 1 n=1 Tax=Selaginella moellendorffii TaxID=88036 RepID=UPI000D1CC2E9|nr:putative glycerol-3-phosphate transporter 1 [Selaginella moellendorffii]|eukprot:XP_024524722.1 putative glycerol-3-phosphate transporter 1 [Selaginella moellendorffii]
MEARAVAPGIQLLRARRASNFSLGFYKASVLGITFLAYAGYHAARKPISIVKAVLHPEYSDPGFAVSPSSNLSPSSSIDPGNAREGWSPFVGSRGKARLGIIDVAFLASYAIGMYFAGHLGDRLNLRFFLSAGMAGSGAFSCLFGMAYWWKVHSLGYFILVQMVAGVFQSTGWPSVVTIVAKWFDKSKRGLIMGIWNCHTSAGNIVGSLLAAEMLQYGWGWSFVAPGFLMAMAALVVFFFLAVDPEEVDMSSSMATAPELIMLRQPHNEFQGLDINSDGEEFREVSLAPGTRNDSAVGFFDAWMIPGVAQFALCLFFSKLVAYTFLYWLPFYIRHTKIAGNYLSDGMSGRLSTLFDVGGMFGGVAAGYISDQLNAKATTAATFLYVAVPALVLYRVYGSSSLAGNVVLMVFLGAFINGPYALITTAVSADLGTHSSLSGSSKALATVTAIIDGTGSVGAAIGPLLTGFVSEKGWDAVFGMLITSVLIAALLLSKLVYTELTAKFASANAAPFQPLGDDQNQLY